MHERRRLNLRAKLTASCLSLSLSPSFPLPPCSLPPSSLSPPTSSSSLPLLLLLPLPPLLSLVPLLPPLLPCNITRSCKIFNRKCKQRLHSISAQTRLQANVMASQKCPSNCLLLCLQSVAMKTLNITIRDSSYSPANKNSIRLSFFFPTT